MKRTDYLHDMIWKRYVRMPYGHLLDNADADGNTVIPTKEDCESCYPNPLSWLTGIENGGFFGGLYLYALVTDHEKKPDGKRKEELLTIARGLFLLCDVSEKDGFIARGVADDGVSHYPVSSEDQVGPWLLGLWKLYHSSAADDGLRSEIAERIKKTVTGIYRSGYRIPTEWDGVYRGSYANDDWRGVCKALFCGMLIDEFAPGLTNGSEYVRLRDEKPAGSIFTRKETASFGFAPDMIKNTGLIQFWIDICAHLCLSELARYDKSSEACYKKALLSNGEAAAKFINDHKEYVNANELPSPPDWRKLSRSPDSKDPEQMFKITGNQFREWKTIFPDYHNEHDIVCNTLSADLIAITCGSPKIKSAAEKALFDALERINFDTMWYSYGFIGEAAYFLLDE